MTQQTTKNTRETKHETKMISKLYSLKDNWHLLQPHLYASNVREVLDVYMADYCHHNSHAEWDPIHGEPWAYSRGSIWDATIMECVEKDAEYQREMDRLYKIHDDWDEVWGSDEEQIIYQKYFDKHSPQKDEPNYYKITHGCHWSAPFVAELLAEALGVFSFVLEKDAHSVACFFQEEDGHEVVYYADLLNDWTDVKDLKDFLESEVTEPMLPIR